MSDLKKFLRLRRVEEITGLKKSAIYDRISQGKFPKPVPLGDFPNSPVGWLEDEISEWQRTRIEKRRQGRAKAA